MLSSIDTVLKEHRPHFNGRKTPVQFFCGTFGLALTRSSGRSASMATDAGIIRRLSWNAELIATGWWPGDERHPAQAFYAYAHPDGIETAAILGPEAAWDADGGEFLMSYAAVRAAVDPRAAIVDFLDSNCRVGRGSFTGRTISPMSRVQRAQRRECRVRARSGRSRA